MISCGVHLTQGDVWTASLSSPLSDMENGQGNHMESMSIRNNASSMEKTAMHPLITQPNLVKWESVSSDRMHQSPAYTSSLM